MRDITANTETVAGTVGEQRQKGHAWELASYVARARDEPCPDTARDAALKCILDLMAATVIGVDDAGPAAIRKAAPGLYGKGEIPIWFTGTTGTVISAAWANASAAAAKDLDDGNRFAAGHPGAAIIPAALAVGQEVGAGVEEILRAIVIGYEVGVTVGAARTTYGSSGTWTPFGVVAAAAALRHTPVGQIEHAFAITGESAPNQSFSGGPAPRIPHPEGAAVKEGIPWGVVTGLTALFMAEAGHTGPRNILDSARHYVFDDELALGRRLHICATYFKPWACCRHIHAPLAALGAVMKRQGIKGAQIDRIRVETHRSALRISNHVRPRNLVDVQYSIPYDLALMALHGGQMLVPVTDAALGLPEVEALAARVELDLNDDFAARYPGEILGRVTVFAGGRAYRSDDTSPPGEPLMDWEELRDKVRTATRFALSPECQSDLLTAMEALRAGRGAPLMACLAWPL